MFRILDDGLDRMVAGAQRAVVKRCAVLAAAAAICLWLLPAPTCLGWLAVMLTLEGWARFARTVVFRHRRGTVTARAGHLITAAAISLGWMSLGWALWRSGAPQGPVCAAALWLSVIFFGQTYAVESPIGLTATGALPAAAMLAIVGFSPDPLAASVGPVWALLALAVAFAGEGAARGLMERRRLADAQGRIVDSEARYRVLADNATDVIALTRLDGKRLYMSPSIAGLLGYDAEEMLAASNFDHLHADDLEDVVARMEALAERGGRETMTYRCRHRSGETIWVETAFAVTDIGEAGAPPTLVTVTRDVTARKAMEAELIEARQRAEQAAQSKTDFLANMSHELRTPLNAIIGFSGLLRQSDRLEERDARHVRLINDASSTLLHIVNGVLDFSRLEAGAVELEAHPFDPLAEAQAVAALVAGQAAAKGLSLETRDAGPGGFVLGDAPRLRQVLLNLLANALKFTSSGGVTLSVRQSAARAPGRPGCRRLRFEVSDTGIGIPADQIEAIFDRFAQADVSVSRRFGGAGLGLAISRHIVALMGGRIGATSVPGKGSTFWFEVVLPKAAAGAARETGAPQAASLDRPLRLLLAEDVAANRELILALLQPFDVVIDLACDGVQAIEAAARNAYDLILMDVQMPVMDGLTAARRIRDAERARAAGRTPIVAMTANVLPEQVARCLEAGMDDHVGKPISPAQLLDAIGRWTRAEAPPQRPHASAA